MSKIIFGSPISMTNASTKSGWVVAYDLDGVLKQKDVSGVIKNVGGLQSVSVDGSTITGDGTPGNPLMVTSSSEYTYEIGEYVPSEGGVIFHRYKDDSNENYLVVTIDDQSTGTTWSNITNQLAGADSTWNGLENSLTITGQTGHTESAAQLCLEYGNSGCNTILITYTLEGEEPVTVEVGNVGDEYTIEGVGTIEKVGSEWIVTDGGTQMFVAVSTSGNDRVSTSENGIDWTLRETDSPLLLSSVFGNGLFVAVGNAVATSDDGITWINRTPSESNTWSSVAYGNNVFVAVSRNGTNRVMTSIDGITWVSRSASENNSWQGVVFADGLFVAVASDGTNRVMTSSDGITWTNRTASQNNDWTSITYGNGLFVAVAQSGTNRVMTSGDGITWTNRTASENNQWMSVTYGNGLFVAVALIGTNRVMTSINGITWVSRSASENNSWRSVTYGNGLFVAVSSNGTNRVMKSTDGITWTSSIIANNQWFGVTFGGREFYATLSEDTECPFGTYTIEEDSIFEAFSVAPVNPKDDWYLPAIDELSLLWQNRFNVNRTLSGNSSFGPILGATQIFYNPYWSSTEYDVSNAWFFRFLNGSSSDNNKGNTYYVRAIRKFSI